jgi:adenine-specific DNA-methyltransferase
MKKNTIVHPTKSGSKKSLGQYFTTSEKLQKFVLDSVKNIGETILEPSLGAGHLLLKFLERDPSQSFIGYEIDTSIKPIIAQNKNQEIIYADFIESSIKRKFKTIIGNPPYVSIAKSKNLYIKFIEKCFNLMEDDGEMVFIVPSDFIRLTGAADLISEMVAAGHFTDFLFPHEENLFEDASIDILVFRYQKSIRLANSSITNLNGLHVGQGLTVERSAELTCLPTPFNVSNGIITFGLEQTENTVRMEELFDIYVGLVTGRDEVYKVDFGNISVLSDKDRTEKFIYVDSYPSGISEQIDGHLMDNQKTLMERRIKTFNDSNWWQWGAPRNIKVMRDSVGSPCIYIRTITRSSEVAFEGTVQFFGGGLLCAIPKTPETASRLTEICAYLNEESVRKNYTFSGRFKIGHKQLCNIRVPVTAALPALALPLDPPHKTPS